jgi:hypothetical protein
MNIYKVSLYLQKSKVCVAKKQVKFNLELEKFD